MQRLIQYAFLLVLSSGAFCATRSNLVPSQGHDIWDAAAGFPGGYVNSVTQTTDGYIWIGTSKGLVRYDGLAFVPIRESDSGTERQFPVLLMVADSKDQLWATDDHTHLFRYADGRLTGPLPDNGKHQYLRSLLDKTRDGRVLFASELQGLVEYEKGSASVLLDPSTIPRSPTAMTQTADGALWIGTRGAGLFHLNLSQGHPEIQHFAALTNVKVNCLLPIGDSTLVIGTNKGLLSLHNGNLTEMRPELGGLEILALANGRDGDIWIGSNGRVFKAHARDIDPEGRIRALDDFKVRGPVTTLFEDRDGDLWIGEPEVIERYRASGFTTYLRSTGLPCSNCGAIYIDHQDRAWFAPWDGGLFQLAKGSIQPIEAAGLKDDTVYSIEGGADGEVWVARKYGGVTRLRLRGETLQATTYTRTNGLASDSIYSIYRAPDGAIWAGTLNAGLSRFGGETWHTFTTHDGLPSNTISAITGSAAGKIFVGTPSGLAVFENGRWVAYTQQEGLPPGAITSLLWDDADTLWIGTTKGISFLRSGSVHVPLRMPDALYGQILGIAESNGWLWITTRDHVLRARSNALLRQSLEPGDYREFGLHEGLPSTEGVKRNRSVVKDHHGSIWLSLNKGISILQPSTLSGPAFPVRIRLDGMLVDGRLVSPDGGVHAPAGHRLTFRYAGVNVSNPDSVRYRYRLDNVDRAWSEPTASREIDYTNVAPGQFRFHVMARNPDGVWNEAGASLDFTILPAYYQTTVFRALCVAAFFASLWAAYQFRVRHLRNEERKLREAVETMPAVAFIGMPDGRRTFVNSRWVEYTGLTEEQALGWGWQTVIHPDDLSGVLRIWQESLASGNALEYEARLLGGTHKDYRWYQTRAVPVRDKHGKIVKWCGVINDIEDRKRAEDALKRSEAYLTEAQSLTYTGSCAIDGTSHETVYWSDEMFRLFDFDPQQGLPSFDQWLQRIHPEDREKLKLANERTFLNKVSCDVEFRIVKPDGTVKHIHGVGHPVLSSTGELVQVVGTMVDITERKRAEEARDRLRRLEADLAHISRVNTMGELTASLAHEIKQPIGAAVTNAEACFRLLDRDQPELPEAKEAALEMVRDAKHAGDIIDRVRLLYQKGSPQLDIVDVNGAIRDMVIVLHNEANRHSVTMRTDLTEELPRVMADQVQLQQALMNLMLNGIEAMRDTSGELTIKSQLADDGQVLISIADTGVGLPAEKIDKIFDAFFTTKSQGTGLGLAITRSIVESHGGRIWAAPNSGRGATFSFTLPAGTTHSKSNRSQLLSLENIDAGQDTNQTRGRRKRNLA